MSRPLDRAARGRLITSAREAKGWSQVALAEKVGLTPATINKIEAGALSGSVDSILAIADALDIDLNLLKREAVRPASASIAETTESERGAA